MKPKRSFDGERHWCATPEVGSRCREESKTTACQNMMKYATDGAPNWN
jgi:hypothetical protein